MVKLNINGIVYTALGCDFSKYNLNKSINYVEKIYNYDCFVTELLPCDF